MIGTINKIFGMSKRKVKLEPKYSNIKKNSLEVPPHLFLLSKNKVISEIIDTADLKKKKRDIKLET